MLTTLKACSFKFTVSARLLASIYNVIKGLKEDLSKLRRTTIMETTEVPYYLILATYTEKAWNALVSNPQNRIDFLRPVVESLGGKVENGFLSAVDYEAIVIVQMPDNVSIAALSMAFLSQFAVKTVKTIPLLTWDEGIEAMKKAWKTTYKPPETNPMLIR